MSERHFKLTFFPARGRAEFMRLIMAQAGVSWEDVIIPREDWHYVKPKMPFENLPILEVDGEIFTQSLAIARYIARDFGLCGHTSREMAKIDALCDGVHDAQNGLTASSMALTIGNLEKLHEEWAKYKIGYFVPFLQRYTKFLKQSASEWFVGDDVTWADIMIAEYVERLDTTYEPGIINEFPDMKAHQERVYNLPNIAKYIANRPTAYPT